MRVCYICDKYEERNPQDKLPVCKSCERLYKAPPFVQADIQHPKFQPIQIDSQVSVGDNGEFIFTIPDDLTDT